MTQAPYICMNIKFQVSLFRTLLSAGQSISFESILRFYVFWISCINNWYQSLFDLEGLSENLECREKTETKTELEKIQPILRIPNFVNGFQQCSINSTSCILMNELGNMGCEYETLVERLWSLQVENAEPPALEENSTVA